jgi:NAD-dependent dihydropyrimidine dehydrogenase PreA subunit
MPLPTRKAIRKIVKIDEEKCTGCGACIIACAEGALKIIDGKARLVSEKYCDGLGNCVDCPEGAISIEEREADDFDEDAVARHLDEDKEETVACGCASANVARFIRPEAPPPAESATEPSRLGHWPVQLALVPPAAAFLKGADLVLAADCVPFARAGFHREFLGEGRALLVACPKLDDFPAHQARLNAILRQADVKSLTVVHMEVPCCSGLVYMARQAIVASGKSIPVRDITINTRGEIINQGSARPEPVEG